MGIFKDLSTQQSTSGGVFSQATQSPTIKHGGIPLSPFGQKPQNNGFQTGLTKVDPTGHQSRSLVEESLPVAGAVGGAMVAAPLGIVGGPAGVIAAGAAGAAGGAALGETAKQGIQRATGERAAISPSEIVRTGAEYGAMEAVGGPIANVVGKGVKALGGVLAKAFIPTSIREAGLLQTYKAGTGFFERIGAAMGMATKKPPVTAGSTAFDKGLAGTQTMIGVQAKCASNDLWSGIVAPALKQADVQINMPTFMQLLEKQIVEQTPEKSRQKELLNALEALKEDYADVGHVPLAELQNFKEGWAKFIPDKAYQGKPIGGAFKDVQNMAASNARQLIYEQLGDGTKQAYLDYGNLKALQELGKIAMTGSKLKGGSFTGLHALFDMTVIPISTVAGQTVYKVGDGIELIGAPGARTVRDVLGLPLGFGSEPDQSDGSQSPQGQ